ncbi:SRPBCC domain-containing protein [Sandaracinus amylolyticus]|uniref:SRPBCC domain-containing protein n=1 Tax=Sandaracinus amylolyticus TaxID=927083 RepID=UPI001F26AA3D|nr:SRPBCC domain-containing protein [Sandaracinus amylolyticus]UJR79304.1 Hypothetical protein I5071_13400 [Sandaracinus amylolyticus]
MAKPKSKLLSRPAARLARDARGHDTSVPARERLELSVTLPIDPSSLYTAWLDAREHGAFTGGQASCEPRVGGRFTAWDGYIEGETLELHAGERIVQAWRTSDFEDDDADSRLEVRFVPEGDGTRLCLKHTELPKGGARKYREDWKQLYFAPMSKYFTR